MLLDVVTAYAEMNTRKEKNFVRENKVSQKLISTMMISDSL